MMDIKDRILKLKEEQNKRNANFILDWDRYKTKNATIFNRILPNKQKVNNKINHDYVGVIINTKIGHFLGNPITITLDDEYKNRADDILKFRRYTAFDRVLVELGIQAGVFGYGCCLAYIDENSKFNFIEVEPWACYFDEENEDLAFRIITTKDENRKEKKIIEAFDKTMRYYFELNESSLIPLSEFKGMKGNIKHLFDDVPLFKFKNNKEELSESFRVRKNIEVLDKLYSDLASEIEQFRLAYIKFVGCKPSDEDVEKMIQTGAISLDEPDSDVDFITKQINIQGTLEAILKEEENVFKFAQTYDSQKNKEGFGQLTNLGIHFMMAPLNNNCKKTIHYFKESLYKLFNFYTQTSDGSWLDPLAISFDFTLDTPRNILEESQIQRNLDGLVSTETRLKLATFVDDAKAEQEKLEAEQAIKDEYNEAENEAIKE